MNSRRVNKNKTLTGPGLHSHFSSFIFQRENMTIDFKLVAMAPMPSQSKVKLADAWLCCAIWTCLNKNSPKPNSKNIVLVCLAFCMSLKKTIFQEIIFFRPFWKRYIYRISKNIQLFDHIYYLHCFPPTATKTTI